MNVNVINADMDKQKNINLIVDVKSKHSNFKTHRVVFDFETHFTHLFIAASYKDIEIYIQVLLILELIVLQFSLFSIESTISRRAVLLTSSSIQQHLSNKRYRIL